MRRIMMVIIGLWVAVGIFAGQAAAQQYPSVNNLKPFSAETNFMSRAGYLRYLVHQQNAQWITYQEAARIVKQQGG